jgi:hypothetical protein
MSSPVRCRCTDTHHEPLPAAGAASDCAVVRVVVAPSFSPHLRRTYSYTLAAASWHHRRIPTCNASRVSITTSTYGLRCMVSMHSATPARGAAAGGTLDPEPGWRAVSRRPPSPSRRMCLPACCSSSTQWRRVTHSAHCSGQRPASRLVARAALLQHSAYYCIC